MGRAADPTMEGPACLALVLHAHLPFVRHPEHEVFLEEDWFFEALTESYLPLVAMLLRLQRDGVPFQLTLSLSPPLQTMLGDELLRRRYQRYTADLDALLTRETARAQHDAPLAAVVAHHRRRLDAALQTWQTLGGDLLAPLARLQEAGHLDLITSAATHGYLPLMAPQPAAVRAQITVAVAEHERRFGRRPSGLWLPECGYSEGLDRVLAAAGLRYFVGDTQALLLARPRPRCGYHAPAFCADSGVAVFARDPEPGEQVWSRERGYPGHPAYRDFFHDLADERPASELGAFVLPDGQRRRTGLKYRRITSHDGTGHDRAGRDGDPKLLYEPEVALRVAHEHAHDFVDKRLAQLSGLRAVLPQVVVVAAYDAELFGHWWHEGCAWLEQVLRLFAAQPRGAPTLTHLADYLRRQPTQQLLRPAESSWGAGGYHQYWLDGTNAWIYPRLHHAAAQMIALAERHVAPPALVRRALNHAARLLLLAQASDWAFIMRSNTAVGYATARTEAHLGDFARLAEQLASGTIDEVWLSERERAENIFPAIDYRAFA
jgi:1,4-alpha-glucan branching enzyme